MTDGSEAPPRPAPRRSLKVELLVLFVLLLATLIVYGSIYQQGLVPDFLLPATPTPTTTNSTLETSEPQAPSAGYIALVQTLTFAPLTQTASMEALLDETLIFTETPTLAVPSPTPTFGACQYKLKAGKDDFLWSIYWGWHINQNIRNVRDFYKKITCAALLENLKCNYDPDEPGTIQPGWILVLPGVKPNICAFHGGTPLP